MRCVRAAGNLHPAKSVLPIRSAASRAGGVGIETGRGDLRMPKNALPQRIADLGVQPEGACRGRNHWQAGCSPSGEASVEIGGVDQPEMLQGCRCQTGLVSLVADQDHTHLPAADSVSRHSELGSQRLSSELRGSARAPGITPSDRR